MFNQQSQQDDATARNVLELAGVSVEQFCEIEAVSESQRNFANNLKIKALAVYWEGVKEEWKTPEMAKAIVQAIREQKSPRFWLDNEFAWSQLASVRLRLREGVKKYMEAVK